MKLPSPRFLLDAFVSSFRRFPLVMLSAIIGTACMMWIIEHEFETLDVVIRLALAAAIGVPLLLAARLMRGDGTGILWRTRLPEVIALVVLAALFFSFKVWEENSLSQQSALLFALVNLASHLLVAVGPFLNRTPDADFWEFNKTLFLNFVIGAVYSALLFGGLAIAIMAVDNLFELDVDGEVYGHLFFLLAGVFNTSYFLYHFPEGIRLAKDQRPEYHIALRNLTKYILIPIVTIYFVILYAYSLKILVQWELPRGWVGSLVLGFSVAGIFSWLLNYYLEETDGSVLVSAFRKWFFPVLLPMTLLLFLAIGRRIQDYGVTEPRMLVANTGVWLFIMCVYFIFAKRPTIKLIPASLILFALASAIGPLSASRVSAGSQVQRLQQKLQEAGLWNDGKIVPASNPLDADKATEIMDILHYLNEWEHLDRLEGWTEKFSGKAKLSFAELAQIEEELGLHTLESPKALSYSFEAPNGLQTLESAYLWSIDVAEGIQEKRQQIDQNFISLQLPDGSEMKLNLTPVLEYCTKTFGESAPVKSAQEGVVDFQQAGWSFRIYVDYLHANVQDTTHISQMRGILLGKPTAPPASDDAGQ